MQTYILKVLSSDDLRSMVEERSCSATMHDDQETELHADASCAVSTSVVWIDSVCT